MDDQPVRQTFDGLSRQQLLIYAQELGEHLDKEENLRNELSKRERQVRELMAACIAAQEEERQWIACEVHDRIAQNLAAAFHQLQVLESMTASSADAHRTALRASTLVRDAIRESRNIMNDLDPPGLTEYGLCHLMNDELHRFQEDRGCQVRFNKRCPTRPSRNVEVTLYRIFHEAMINIKKHAPTASRVVVSIVGQDEAVRLQVQDNGQGFNVEAATQAKRVGGLMSMRRRAAIVGGTFEVTSSPKKGTKLTIVVPAGRNGCRGEKPQ
ncbi:MAG: ATP-binding protein [Chloroflexota bacterium]